MRIAVASGKGGTGKTIISTSLAWLLAKEGIRTCYVDSDVEEPNGHLFLHPEITSRRRFSVLVPELNAKRCSGCGECQRFCTFNAIIALPNGVLLFPELCHSCGGCLLACPEVQLKEVPREMGTIEEGTIPGLPTLCFRSATLDVGEAMATPLIAGLQAANGEPADTIVIVDAPPGTSCSAMEAVNKADVVVLVTEPTPFGLHDLILAVEMCRALGKPMAAVINRANLGDEMVRNYLRAEEVPILAEIPFLFEVARAYAEGQIAAELSPAFASLVAPLELLAREVS